MCIFTVFRPLNLSGSHLGQNNNSSNNDKNKNNHNDDNSSNNNNDNNNNNNDNNNSSCSYRFKAFCTAFKPSSTEPPPLTQSTSGFAFL